MCKLYINGLMSLVSSQSRLSIDTSSIATTFISHATAHSVGDLWVWGLRCELGNLCPINDFSGGDHG